MSIGRFVALYMAGSPRRDRGVARACLFIAIMLILTCLSSCNHAHKGSTNENTGYVSELQKSVNGFYGENAWWDVNDKTVQQERTLTLDGTVYYLQYHDTRFDEVAQVLYDRYTGVGEQKGTDVSLEKDSGLLMHFRISTATDRQSDAPVLEESEIAERAMKIASGFITVDDYEMTITPASNSSGEISHYYVTFRKTLVGFVTSDLMDVYLDPHGTLTGLDIINTNRFPSDAEPAIDRDKVEASISEKLNDLNTSEADYGRSYKEYLRYLTRSYHNREWIVVSLVARTYPINGGTSVEFVYLITKTGVGITA